MKADHQSRGGAAVGVLNRMEAWEANLVLNLRLWCDGPCGQNQVWNEFRKSLPSAEAQREYNAFETLLKKLIANAHRPLVRHTVGCACLGSDESVFVNLTRCASDGHLNDAALVATLLVGPAHAEIVALLAGQVGECARRIHDHPPEYPHPAPQDVVRLH